MKRCGSGLTFAKNRGFVSGSNVVKVDGLCICLVNCSRHRRDWTGARLQQSLRLCNLNSISTLLHNYFCYYGPKIYTEFVSPSRDQNEAMHSFTCSFCDFPSLPAMPSPTISVPSPVNKNDGVLMIFFKWSVFTVCPCLTLQSACRLTVEMHLTPDGSSHFIPSFTLYYRL